MRKLTAGIAACVSFSIHAANLDLKPLPNRPSLPQIPVDAAPKISVAPPAAIDPAWTIEIAPAAARDVQPPEPGIPTAYWRPRGHGESQQAILHELAQWRDYCAWMRVQIHIQSFIATLSSIPQRGQVDIAGRRIILDAPPESLDVLGRCLSAQLRLMAALGDRPPDREPTIGPAPGQWEREVHETMQRPSAYDVQISDSPPPRQSVLVVDPGTQLNLTDWTPREDWDPHDIPCVPRQVEKAKWIRTPVHVGFNEAGDPIHNYYYRKFTYVIDDYSHCR